MLHFKFRELYFYLQKLLVVFCMLFCISLQAQQVSYLDVEKGLSGRQTFNVVQDRKGFIWISTYAGIDRYDGATIKKYPIDMLYKNRIVRKIRVILDRESNLWAYTDRGSLFRYDRQQDDFILYKNLDRYIRSIHFDNDNNLWVGFAEELANVTSLDSISIPIFREINSDEKIVQIMDFDVQHFLIVTSKDVYKFNIHQKTFMSVFSGELSGRKKFSIEACFFDSEMSELWIGAVNHGLYVYDMNKKLLRSINDQRLFDHPILCIQQLDEKYLLLGTDGLGACLLNKEILKIENIYTQQSSVGNRISANAVYDIYVASKDKVYLSTFSGGVSVLNFSGTKFHVIKHEENNLNSLCNDVVCDILEDHHKNLWFATNNGMSRWNKKTDKWTKMLEGKNVLNLFLDSKGNIWAGTFSSGVFVFNKEGQLLANYVETNDNKGLGSNFIYTTCEDEDGNIWLGGRRGNLTKYDARTKTFSQLSASQINLIISQGASGVLMATEHGVFRIKLSEMKRVGCSFNKNLKSLFVTDMYIESDSILWVSTYGGGIGRCNFNTGDVQSFTKNDGLPSNMVHALLSDEKEILWFSSDNGIGYLDTKTCQVRTFSKADGLSGNQFRQLSRVKDSNGMFFFGSYEGVTCFYPDEIQKRNSTGKLIFGDFYLFNKVVKPNAESAILEKSLDNTSKICLNYKQHSFSINFTAVDFLINESRRYMWRLDGLETDWYGPTKEHMAHYTNIKPGEYVFQVKYMDDNNMVIDKRKIEITVSPPFWETIWARIIFLLSIIGLVYFAYWYILQSMKKKQSEEKIEFFINTAHDLRTPLTLISAPIYELKEDIIPTERSEFLLKIVLSNLDKLNKMFSQLLDFQKAYELKDQLLIREYDVNRYLTEKYEAWAPMMESKSRTLELVIPEQVIREWFDAEKMDKILDNLLSNALKYTKKKGKIVLQLTHDNTHWKIAVIDDGIGISRQGIKSLFSRFYRARNAVNSQISGSGLGLLLIKRYVSLHKGRVTVNSVENKGAEFYLQFKRGNRHFHSEVVLDAYDMPIHNLDQEDKSEEQAVKVKTKVLVVEDNDDLRDYLKLSLNYYYQIFTASNGLEAWEIIPEVNPDIIVSDYQMPLMDGFQLCEKVKRTFKTSHIPIIILTVLNDKTHIERGFTVGADDYIEKPFDIKYLRLKIDSIIQNRKLLRQKYLGSDNDSEMEKTDNSLNDEFISRATRIIQENIDNRQFTISGFSKELGLSRSLLYAKFNTITGYTPNDFIKVTRMKKAICYFKEKKYSINEVALMVGFEEPSYFSTCFKKIYGKSPKQFIEDNQLNLTDTAPWKQ